MRLADPGGRLVIDLAAVKAGRGLTERAACKRLANLAAKVPADHEIVELGSFRGRTTAWLAWGAEQGHGAPVIAVDPWTFLEPLEVDGYLEPQYERGEYAHPDTYRDYTEHLERCGVTRALTVRATAVQGAEMATEMGLARRVGLLFHDALHAADAVEADLRAWLPHLAPSCTVALHDAAEQRFGVVEGARRVLPHAGFDWPGKLHRWKKHPERRGLLVVSR